MPPPPYNQITGIYTVDDKHQSISRADYNGMAKPGQLVIDTSDYSLWVGNSSGNLIQLGPEAGSGTVTSVSAAAPLSITGSATVNPTINLSTVPISKGGTGETTAAAALAALLPTQAANSGKILSTNGTNASWTTLGIYSVIYVTKGGNDSIADGSMTKPFLTITAAMNYINTTYPVTLGSGQEIVVVIGPGTYSENITVNRFLTHFTGLEGKQKTTRINGQITVNSSTDYSGLYQNEVSFSNLFISNTNNSCITVSGTQPTSLDIFDCVLYTSGTGVPLIMNNTAAGGNRLRVYIGDIIAVGNAPALDVANVSNGAISTINSSSASTTYGWRFATSTITLTSIQLTSDTCANLISILSGTINIGYSAFTNTTANGTGIDVSSGATFVTSSVVYNIVSGTGYAVRGVAGSVFVYSYNSMLPGTNTRISSAMTSIPMTTSFTSVP